jgi:hypothetical protein
MQTSVFLARLIGPLFLAVGIGLITNAATYRKMAGEFLASTALVYLSGLLTMTAGLAIILNHNVWVADWRVLITILGWLGVIGGAVRIVGSWSRKGRRGSAAASWRTRTASRSPP